MRPLAVWLVIAAATLVISPTPQNLHTTQAGGSLAQMYGCCLYDPNPAHIWNRLYLAIFIRQQEYGWDELDPLLWYHTKFLLEEPSHEQAVLALDNFLKGQSQNQIRDPVKRAVFEHDLWSVFDWSALSNSDFQEQRRDLQVRLAEIMRRVALTKDEIASLPDNYKTAVESREFIQDYDPANPTRPFLPPDPFRSDSDWVFIGGNGLSPLINVPAYPVSKNHIDAFSGRSTFLEFIRIPKGRKATFDYLRSVWDYPEPWIARGKLVAMNPAMPQFPDGTELLLVRRMNLFDRYGSLVNAPLTESVQIRVYRSSQTPSETTYEFRLDRAKLFAGDGDGLRAVAPDERDFAIFNASGIDLEQRNELGGCANCHSNFGPGIRSVRSISSLLKPNPVEQDSEAFRSAQRYEATATLSWKQNQYNWGLLNSYWKSAPAQ
jgi:hypothetical protein